MKILSPRWYIRGCADWGVSRPQYCPICKKVGQKAAMLEESWQQYFLWPFFSKSSQSIGQNAPPQQKVSQHITGYITCADQSRRAIVFPICFFRFGPQKHDEYTVYGSDNNLFILSSKECDYRSFVNETLVHNQNANNGSYSNIDWTRYVNICDWHLISTLHLNLKAHCQALITEADLQTDFLDSLCWNP